MNGNKFKSVRSKPQSFGGWKENVKKMCKSEDITGLESGHKLWKVRKKTLMGLKWTQKKFKLNFSSTNESCNCQSFLPNIRVATLRTCPPSTALPP